MSCYPCAHARRAVRKVILTLCGLAVLLVMGFGQTGFTQATPPLSFENNYFVTGDYVVAGAYNMNQTVVNGMTTGVINVPDKNPSTGLRNPGITGATSVPTGAHVIAAFLYWETVESNNNIGAGQNGFFAVQGQSYALAGIPLPTQSSVSWSSGGCPSNSTGRIVTVYRANVGGLLPHDSSGNVLANSTYQVTLPSSSSGSPPITLGATLVIIYRVLSKDVPLNSIVIYDGAYGQSTFNVPSSLLMTQTVLGFYDAATNPVTRLTHIVGSGQSNKFQTVYFSTDPNNVLASPLPSLYGSGQAAFPGYYGDWDTVTWTFGDSNYPSPANPVGPPSFTNPVQEDARSATTEVVPSTSQQGCVDWGATIVSTTVKNTDGDGILNVWKHDPQNPAWTPGYCDVAILTKTNPPATCSGPSDPSWVDLTGAQLGTPGNPHPDVFVQLDYMCQSKESGTNACGTGYSFNPYLITAPGGETVVQKVIDAFADSTNHQPIYLHVSPRWAIQEQTFGSGPSDCTDFSGNPVYCAYPGQSGVVAWKGGFVFLKNQLVDSTSGDTSACTTSPPPANCVPRFQHGRKDSWHYALFGHAAGQPNWNFQSGLTDSIGTGAPAGVVSQSGNTITFYTSTAHGLVVDSTHGNGRVTISYARTNAYLNGTYLVASTLCPANTNTSPPTPNDCSAVNTAPGPYIFTVQIGGPSLNASYTQQTDPDLSIARGRPAPFLGFPILAAMTFS